MPSSRPVLSAVLSAPHLLALASGLPAAYLRGRALRGRLDPTALARLFAADNVWGAAALLRLPPGSCAPSAVPAPSSC